MLGVGWEYLLLLVWGHRKNFTEVAERAAPWAHASTIPVPDGDVFDGEPGDQLAEPSRSRERFTPKTCWLSPSTAWRAGT
jgi:hypothetical protein